MLGTESVKSSYIAQKNVFLYFQRDFQWTTLISPLPFFFIVAGGKQDTVYLIQSKNKKFLKDIKTLGDSTTKPTCFFLFIDSTLNNKGNHEKV